METKLKLDIPWEEVKEKLKEANTELTDADLEILNGAQAELDEAIIKGSGSEGSKDE